MSKGLIKYIFVYKYIYIIYIYIYIYIYMGGTMKRFLFFC